MSNVTRIDLTKPKYDQSTFGGRLKHFFSLTNPLNLLVSPSQLNHAKSVVDKYINGESVNLSQDELWKSKYLVDSAFHPDTGEKMFIVGRMSAQVPMNMLITGCMLTFYLKPSHIIFWQWVNQSFNAVVNYTNRSGDSPIPMSTLSTSYVSATGSALVVAMGMNKFFTKMKIPPIFLRFVPFLAVVAANCVNIPLMRRSELTNGVPVFDSNNNLIDSSKNAAKNGIMKVVLSRNLIAMPAMLSVPIFMARIEKKPFLMKYPFVVAPLQVLIYGVFLVFMTPLGCALFPQQSSLPVEKLEQSVRDKLIGGTKHVYFNKGL